MIIGLCGLIGAGKGTVADILVDQGFKKVSLDEKTKKKLKGGKNGETEHYDFEHYDPVFDKKVQSEFKEQSKSAASKNFKSTLLKKRNKSK